MDVFQQRAFEERNNKDTFQRYAEGTVRNTEKMKFLELPDEDLSSTYVYDSIKKSKSLGDYAQDAAVDVTKTGITAGETVVGLLDLGLWGARKAASGYQNIGNAIAPDYVPEPESVKFGVLAKQLDEGLGVNFDSAKKHWEESYSDIRKEQQQELQTGQSSEQLEAFNNTWSNAYQNKYLELEQNGASKTDLDNFTKNFNTKHQAAYSALIGKGDMSLDKSIVENLSVLGDKFGYVLDNPSLGLGAAVESAGYLVPSRALSKTVMKGEQLLAEAGKSAVERAVMRSTGSFKPNTYIAAGIGEGTVAATAIANQLRNESADGLVDDNQMGAAVGAGALTGLIGGASGKLGARYGIGDIDAVGMHGARLLTQEANKLSGATKAVLGTASEAGQEFLQSIGESVLPNIAQGKDPLTGLASDLALSTFAGGAMGAASNAPGLLSSTATGLKEAVTGVKDKVTQNTYEEMSSFESGKYNAAEAYTSQVPDLFSGDADVQAQAQTNIDNLTADLTQAREDAKAQYLSLFQAKEDMAATSDAATLTSIDTGLKEAEESYKYFNKQYMALQAEITKVNTNQQVVNEQTTSEDQNKAIVAILTQDPETVAPEQQQEAVNHVTKFMSSYNSEDLQALADSSLILSPEQRDSLRLLADVKIAQNQDKTANVVNKEVTQGFKGATALESTRGLDDYTQLVQRGVASQNVELLDATLTDLDQWALSHSNKATTLTQAFDMVKDTSKTVQVVRTANQQWKIIENPKEFLRGNDFKANGAYNVHRGSNNSNFITRVADEAQLIGKTYAALDSFVNTFGTPQDVSTKRLKKTVTGTPYTGSISTDAEGKPQLWFHGTAGDFESFDLDHKDLYDNGWLGAGVYLTDSKVHAEVYASKKSRRTKQPKNVMQLNVSSSKFLQLTQADKRKFAQDNSRAQADAFTAWAKAQGYEGIVVESGMDWGREIVVFDPNHVSKVQTQAEPTGAIKPDPTALVPALQAATAQQRKDEQRKPYRQRNMLLAHFDQKVEAKTNPLVLVKDFMSNLLNVNLKNLLGKEVTAVQQQQLEHFNKFRSSLSKTLSETFRAKPSNAMFKDFSNFLVNQDGKFDENTLTALSLAAYSWFIEKGAKTHNSNEDILAMLHASEDAVLPAQVAARFRNIGNQQSTVIYELGTKASQLLGLKVRSDSDPTFQSRLDGALGGLLFVALTNQQLLLSESIPGAEMQQYQDALENASFKAGESYPFLRANFNLETFELDSRIQEVVDKNKDTKGFLTSLFGNSIGLKAPLLGQPTKYEQTRVNNTQSVVSDQQVKNITESQKNSFTMRTNTVNLFKNLYEKNADYLHKLLGIHVDDAVLAEQHISKRESFKATALNEQRALNNALEFVGYLSVDEQGKYTSFWDTQHISANNRMYYDSNMFNVQTSQIHRAMAGLSAFEAKIDLSQVGVVGKHRDNYIRFLQGVAEGMEGVAKPLLAELHRSNPKYRFGTVDKVAAADFIPVLEDYLNQDKIQEAVESMVALIQDKATQGDAKRVAAVVSEWGMGVQSLQSLIHLAEMQMSVEQGTEFTTTVGLGSDGVNNGVAIANTQTGVISPEMRVQTGLIPMMVDQPYESMQDVYADGVPDYYVSFGLEILRQWQTLKESVTKYGKVFGTQPWVQSLEATFTTFTPDNMRKIAKAWSVPFNYSAGFPRLKSILAQTYLDGVYAQFVAIADQAITAQEAKNTTEYQAAVLKRNALQQHLNNILKVNASVQVNLPAPEFLKEWDFGMNTKGGVDTALQTRIFKGFDKALAFAHGKAAENATKEFAKDYIKVRDIEVAIHRAAFNLFDFVRQKTVEQKLAEFKKDSLIDTDGFEGLSQQELDSISQQLRTYAPVLNTLLSGQSENSLESGITLIDQTRKLKPIENSIDHVEISHHNQLQGTKTRGTKLGLRTVSNASVGVKGFAAQVQAVDAGVSSTTTAKTKAINVHDANIGGVADFLEMAQVQNEAFLQGMMTQHLQLENTETLLRTLQGIVDLAESLGIKQEEVNTLFDSVMNDGKAYNDTGLNTAMAKFLGLEGDALNDYRVGTTPVHFLRAFLNYAQQLEQRKLDVLSNTYSVHQYAGENGAVALTDEHRKQIEDQRTKVKDRSETVGKQLAQLTQDVGSIEVPKAEKKTIEVKSKKLDNLQQWLEQRKDSPIEVAELLGLLGNLKLPMNEKVILDQITKLLPQNLIINYFDTSNIPKYVDTLNVDTDKVHAWYDLELNTINIKSVDSKGAKVNSETVVHELLHAALALRIQEVQSNKDKHVEAAKALDGLEQLRTELLQEFKGNTVVEGMLESVDEFISYGLTDISLQDILKSRLVNRNGRKPSALKSAFKAFMEAISGILGFRANKVNSFAAFIHDTALLMQHLDTVVPKPTVGMLFSQHSFNNPGAHVNSLDSLDVLKQMDSTGLSIDLNTHLDHVIDTTIAQLYHNDAQAKAQVDQITTAPNSEAAKAGFNLTPKEQHVQQVVKLVLDTYKGMQEGSFNLNQIRKMAEQASRRVKVQDMHQGDWGTASPLEKDLTQSKYDYVFSTQGSDFVTRFMSMSLSSAELRAVLERTVEKPTVSKNSWFDRITSLYAVAVAWLSDRYSRVDSTDSIKSRLDKLTRQMTQLDVKARQERTRWYAYLWNLIGKVTTPLNKISGGAGAYVFGRDFFIKSKYSGLRVLGGLAALTPGTVSDDLPQRIKTIRDNFKPNTRVGLATELMQEVSSPSTLRKITDTLIRRANQNSQHRQSVVDNTKKAILGSFKEGAKNLSKEQHKAVTNTLLRSDIQALLTEYDIDTVFKLLSDTHVRTQETNELEQAILANPNGNDMLIRAKQLAYYMIHNVGGSGLVKNAVSIASGIDTVYQGDILSSTEPLVKQLDALVSLYALGYSSSTDRAHLNTLLKAEPDALKGIIQLHNSLAKDSYKDFKDNPLSFTKGYMPERVNPYREIYVATSKAERASLEKQGWKFISELDQDPMGIQSEKYMMIHHDRGYQRLVSGAIDLMDTSRKGTTEVTRSDPRMSAIVKARLNQSNQRAKQSYKNFDPSKTTGLIASYDNDGFVLSYRYEMSAFVRDEHLERNQNFAELLGHLAGSIQYKPANTLQNTDVVNALVLDYKANYTKNPNAYVSLSPLSTNPKDIETWRMLPHDFRMKAEKAFGKGNPIVVHNDILNMVFGFKKYSLAQMFDRVSNDQNAMEKMFIGIMKGILGDRAQGGVARIEHIVQEIVSLAKDIIVIRSIGVLWGNIISNTLMLMARGINPIQALKDTQFALSNARNYHQDKDEILQLEAQIQLGGNTVELTKKLARVQERFMNNPLNEFINAGMLSSIVEDVTVQQSDYTYSSGFQKKVEAYTSWIPSPVKTTAEWLMISPSTAPYQFLASTTQLSDFVAKYTLYSHLRKEGMSFEEATQEASQTFINYDTPTSPFMQYANDMGFFMFTKFFLRIQSVLLRQMDKRSASVIGQHLATEMFTNTPGVLDPLMINRLGNNPFEGSAASIFSAVGENPIINTVF